MIVAETRDEDALRQGEADEPLELINFNSTQLEKYVKIGTKITKDERQQLKQLLLKL